MTSKIHIRNLIANYKYMYTQSKDKDLLLYIAILKGMYISVGGKKGIPLDSNLDFIVKISKIIFTFINKLADNRLKAYNWLYNELRRNGIYLDILRNYKICECNRDYIAAMLAELVISVYTEDIFINYNKIFNITKELIIKTEKFKGDYKNV